MDSMIVEPKSGSGMPFLIFLAIVIILGGYGVIRAMKAGGGMQMWLLAVVVLVAIGIGTVILRSRQKAEPIIIYSDRIECSSWSIPLDRIRGVREDRVSATQYSGGRPVVSTQRRLVLDTDEGPKVVAYEATYDLDALKSALEAALSGRTDQ